MSYRVVNRLLAISCLELV